MNHAIIKDLKRRCHLAQKYKTGDIVQLKSGGPKMTVARYNNPSAIDTSPNVWCDWFAGSKHEKACFPEDSIQPAQADKKP